MTPAVIGYEKLSRADSSLAQQRSADQELQLLELLLSACIDEISLTLDAFLPAVLRSRLCKAFGSNERILDAEVRRVAAPALLCLIHQGSLPQSEFEMFTGLSSGLAKTEVDKMQQLGILNASGSKCSWIDPGMPGWFTSFLCLISENHRLRSLTS